MTAAPLWLAVGVVVLLAVPMVLDLRRRTGRRPARLVAGLVALGALMALGLRPDATRTAVAGRSLLLTRGADPEWAARVLREDGPWREVYRMDGADGAVGGRRVRTLVGGVGHLANRDVRDTLHVLGDGLREWEWEQYEGVVVYRDGGTTGRGGDGSGPLVGFAELMWGRWVRLGGSVSIVGVVGAGAGASVRLLELGDVVDSAEVGEAGGFELRYAPREVGRRVLEIELDVAGGADGVPTVRQRIGVSVREPLRPGVLVLEGSPTFETRYLKNWLAQRGSEVAVRSAISSGRYRSEYLNRAPVGLARVTSGLLGQFDLVVVDARTWWALGGTQRNVLLQAAAEDELGVIFLADAAFLDSLSAGRVAGRLGAFSANRIGDLALRTVTPEWVGARHDSPAVLPALPFEIASTVGVEGVVVDEFGAIMVAARPGAGGSLTLSLIGESYRWLLQERAEEYGSYWAHLIDAALGGSAVPAWNLAARGPVFAGSRVDVVLHNTTNPTGARLESPDATVAPLALARDEYQPDHWSGRVWPTRAGWYLAVADDTAEFWFYVNDQDDWPGLQRQLARSETGVRAELNPADGRTGALRTTDPVPLVWFFLAFCLGAGFLWLEPRVWG